MPSLRTILAIAVFLGSCAVGSPASAGEAVVPYFRLKGALPEAPPPLGIPGLLGEEMPLSMFDLLEKLRTARTDERVQAVIVDINEANLGFAQIQELRAQFDALRAADKSVWLLCESLDNQSLMLGSAASRFYFVPSGDVNFNGFYGEAAYFKNLLDNIRVEADIIHYGDYKSAGEPFYRTGPSEESLEQENRLLDGLFGQIVESIAESRRISPDQVRGLIDRGYLTATDALEAGLVDKLGYREDFVASIKKNYGADADVDRQYGAKKGPEINFGDPFAFFKLFSEMMKGPEESKGRAVAVVFVEGMITTGKTEQGLFGPAGNAGSDTVRGAIAKAAADDNVEALVLRVDSPGGSALASDIICEATKRFKESGRPVIVSMGNVAASGGYYVSALADTIFAEPGTITGSIGVVGGKLVTKGLWDWIGVTGHEFKRGKHADINNSNRRYTDDERKLVMAWMGDIYGDFKDRVVAGRKSKLGKDIEALAGGRVYTGKEALDLGLVDRLGGFADAVKFAAREAELGNDYEIKVFPRPKTMFDILAEAFGGGDEDDEFVSLRAPIGSKFARHPMLAGALEAARSLDPARARALQSFLIQLELLSEERVLLIGPPWAMAAP